MKKSIKNFIPHILIAVLLISVAIVLYKISPESSQNPSEKPIVDMSLPIEKTLDETNKIQMPYGSGTREKIQVKFTWKAGDMSYSDALYFTPEQYEKLTPDEIEKMKLERMTNWANTVNTASRQE